jgi:putative peptidoglycan lipid II flippase
MLKYKFTPLRQYINMFNKIFQKYNTENYRQILLVTSLLIVSKAFGLIRQSLLGGNYLDSDLRYSDMFFNAQKIQDTLIAILIMGTIISTLSPSGAKILAVKGEEGFSKYIKINFWIFLALYLIISILCAIFVEDILKLTMFKAYTTYVNAGLKDTFVDSARVLCFGVVFFAINTLFQTYLNLKNSFFWNNLSGIITNIVLIIALIISPQNFVLPVSIGLVISFALVSIMQYLACKKNGLGNNLFKLSTLKSDIKEYRNYIIEDFKQIIPKFFLIPVTTLTSLLISAKGAEGNATFYETATIIQGIFLTIIGAVGMVILPKLSHSLANENPKQFYDKVNNYLTKLMPITVVGSVLTIIFAQPMLYIILALGRLIKRGSININFGEQEYLTIHLTQILALSIIFLAINEILIKYFLVKNQVKRLLFINTFCLVLVYLLTVLILNTTQYIPAFAITISFTITTAIQSLIYYILIYFDNKVKSN